VDYDADGDLDILSGSYTGEIYLFERGEAGEYLAGQYLMNAEGTPLGTGTSVTPEALDMDADGDLDLVIGTRTSGVFVVTNEGSRSTPSWASEPTRLLTAKGEKIEGSNAHHADWDGDGLRDLIVGSESGGVRWHRNLGANNAPSYGVAATLVEARDYEERKESEGPSGPGSRTKVHVTDWNGDGRMDLLVGDVQWLYETLSPLTEAEVARKAALQPAHDTARDAYWAELEVRNSYVGKPGGIPEEVLARCAAAREKLDTWAAQMHEFERKKSHIHGWVWLYLRKSQAGQSAAGQVEASALVRRPVDHEEFGPTKLELFATPLQQDASVIRVRARLTIEDGWHTYKTVPAASGYVPMQPSLDLPAGVEVIRGWQCASKGFPDPSGEAGTWFLDQAEFTCELRLLAETDEEVGVQLEFQVCDDKLCLPPRTLSLSLGRVVGKIDSPGLRLAKVDAMLPRFVTRWIPSKGSSIMPPGKTAPAFSLTDDQGVQRSSSDFVGQRYILWFYPKASTPG